MVDLTVDMGNFNTVITFREDREGVHGLLQGVAREVQELPGSLFVPTLVHVGEDTLIGEEVLRAGLYDDPGSFHDLKDHILHHAPVARNVRGVRVTHKKAAAAFLSHLTRRLHAEIGEPLNFVFLFPTDGGEMFRDHLRYVDLEGARSVTLLDEDTAAALGAGVNLFMDDLLMVFDFGFSAVRTRLVQFNWRGREAYAPPVVRGSVSLPLGTADLKLRILQELHADEDAGEKPDFYWKKFTLHSVDASAWTHERFQEFLRKEDLAAQVQKAIDRALEEAELGGVSEREIKKVVLIGGGTRIPMVRRTLEENFGERLVGHHPEVDAGRGGIAFLSESRVDDMVNETYAIEVRDPITGEYQYPVVVERFTRYPTRNPTARYIVNTFYDGQYELHLRVFRTRSAGRDPGALEILFGDDRKISFVSSGAEDAHDTVMDAPLVLPVNPPGRVGERRFLLEFRVDNQKRLLVSAKDLREEKVLWEDRPLLELA